MNPSPILISLALLLGASANAVAAESESRLTGTTLHAAKRFNARPNPPGSVEPISLSGVPMSSATRSGAQAPSQPAASAKPMLSGVPMVVAKRL